MTDGEMNPNPLPGGEQTNNPESLLPWQIEQIKKGIEQADRGQVVSHEEVLRLIRKRFR